MVVRLLRASEPLTRNEIAERLPNGFSDPARLADALKHAQRSGLVRRRGRRWQALSSEQL